MKQDQAKLNQIAQRLLREDLGALAMQNIQLRAEIEALKDHIERLEKEPKET